MYLVGVDGREIVLAFIGMSRKHGFELHRLPRNQLFSGQTTDLTVRAPPPATAVGIFGETGYHVPVFRVDKEVCVVIAVFLERIRNLDQVRYWQPNKSRILTLVATICLSQVQPGNSQSP